MRTQFLLIALGMAILSGIGCKRIPYVESTPNSIFPLEPGNWWRYVETIEISDSGSILATAQDTIYMKVAEKGYLDWNNPENDAPYVHLETFEIHVTRPGNTIVLYLRPESGGIFHNSARSMLIHENPESPCYLSEPSNTINQATIPFPDTTLNAKGLNAILLWGCVEDSILESFQQEAINHNSRIHFVGEELINVPAGSFQAINFSDREWWSPGVGWVKMEQSFDGTSIPYRRYYVSRELLAYGE